jgi:hypothetical protein
MLSVTAAWSEGTCLGKDIGSPGGLGSDDLFPSVQIRFERINVDLEWWV